MASRRGRLAILVCSRLPLLRFDVLHFQPVLSAGCFHEKLWFYNIVGGRLVCGRRGGCWGGGRFLWKRDCMWCIINVTAGASMVRGWPLLPADTTYGMLSWGSDSSYIHSVSFLHSSCEWMGRCLHCSTAGHGDVYLFCEQRFIEKRKKYIYVRIYILFDK